MPPNGGNKSNGNPPVPPNPRNEDENGNGPAPGGVDDQDDDDQPPPPPERRGRNWPTNWEPGTLRRSTRERTSTRRSDNTYGAQPPADVDRNVRKNIGSDVNWNRQIYGDEPGPSRRDAQDQPAANNPVPEQPFPFADDDSDDEEATLTWLVHEGEVAFLDYLLNQADKSTVQNWQFCDLMHISAKEWQPWLDKCQEEIDSLIK